MKGAGRSMTRDKTAARGLQLLMVAEAIQLAVAAASALGLLQMLLLFSGMLGMASIAMDLAGLGSLRGLDPRYARGFHLAIAEVTAAFLGGIVSTVLMAMERNELVPVLMALLSVASLVFQFLIVRSCCQATGALLMERGADGLADQGAQAALLYGIVAVVSGVCQGLSLTAIPDSVYRFLAILSNVLLAAAAGFYARFLYQSTKTLAAG